MFWQIVCGANWYLNGVGPKSVNDRDVVGSS